jgi:uncharacterized membrane-anchored protein
MAILALMLGAALAVTYLRSGRMVAAAGEAALPETNANYWLCMLVAGTLGTVLGDYCAVDAGLGLGQASIVLSFALGLIFYFGRGRLRWVPLYWSTIVVVRAAGTAVGDYLASNRGLGLGLQLSTALTGLLFIATLIVWRERARSQ